MTNRDGVRLVRLEYPGCNGKDHTIELELEHVRAADSIRIHYDFDRDGWAIQQASTFEWDNDDPVMDEDWQEVAFIQAWAREKKPTDGPEGTKR